jgi:hypothetical protein
VFCSLTSSGVQQFCILSLIDFSAIFVWIVPLGFYNLSVKDLHAAPLHYNHLGLRVFHGCVCFGWVFMFTTLLEYVFTETPHYCQMMTDDKSIEEICNTDIYWKLVTVEIMICIHICVPLITASVNASFPYNCKPNNFLSLSKLFLI